MEVTFVSYEELVKDTYELANKLPICDLVLGVERSGMIPAMIIAEHWNVPCGGVNQFVDKQNIFSGARCKIPTNVKTILVIDDTMLFGKSMTNTMLRMSRYAKQIKMIYAVVYSSDKCDYTKLGVTSQRTIIGPRIFQWNMFHHNPLTSKMLFDLDGTLCVKPTQEENDYGEKYLKFIKGTKPILIPNQPIIVVTGRLERYRKETEDWLDAHGFNCVQLLCRDSRETNIVVHKSKIYANSDAFMFIEDEELQAKEIARLTKKPVLWTGGWKVFR
jgi:hypoxanthine phosphoribosyltransferase